MAGINDVFDDMHDDLMDSENFGVDLVTVILGAITAADVVARARRPQLEQINEETGDQLVGQMIVRIAKTDLPVSLQGISATNWERATVTISGELFAVDTVEVANNRIRLTCLRKQHAERTGRSYRHGR